MDSCHLIWLGKEVKIKEADDKKKKKLKGQVPGSTRRFEERQRGGMEATWLNDGS